MDSEPSGLSLNACTTRVRGMRATLLLQRTIRHAVAVFEAINRSEGRCSRAVRGADESSMKSCATTLACAIFAINGMGSFFDLERLPIGTVAR